MPNIVESVEQADQPDFSSKVLSSFAINDVTGSGIIKVVCPSCGLLCIANLPAEPKLGETPKSCDSACMHCQKPFYIERYEDGQYQTFRDASTKDGTESHLGQGHRASDTSVQVGLVELGSNLPDSISIKKTVEKINGLQSSLKFNWHDRVKPLGEPTERGNLYSLDHLVPLVQQYDQYRYLVVVTSASVDARSFPIKLNNDQWIIFVYLSESSKISLHPNWSIMDYSIVNIVVPLLYILYLERMYQARKLSKCELLNILAAPASSELDLLHREQRQCVFIFSDDSHLHVNCTRNANLCPFCFNRISGSTLGESISQAFVTILKRIRRPTLRRVLNSIMRHPGWNFLFGSVLTGISVNLFSDRLSDVALWIVPCLSLLAIGVMYLVEWRKSR